MSTESHLKNVQGSHPFCYSFYESIADVQYLFISGVQNCDLMFICITNFSPWLISEPSVIIQLLKCYWLFLVLYIISLWLYFITRSSDFLISFIYFIHAHILSPQVITSLFSGSMSLCFVLFDFIFKFQIWSKSHGICLSLPDIFPLA